MALNISYDCGTARHFVSMCRWAGLIPQRAVRRSRPPTRGSSLGIRARGTRRRRRPGSASGPDKLW
eukprot:12813-Eustigmatos_ZCMA.PRE.1